MNQQHDPNPLKGISVKEALYLSQSKDDEVRRNATYVLASYQRHIQDFYKQTTLTPPTQSQLSVSGEKEKCKCGCHTDSIGGKTRLALVRTT